MTGQQHFFEQKQGTDGGDIAGMMAILT